MTNAEMVKRLAWAYNYLDEHDDIENAKPLILEVGKAIFERIKPLVSK